MRELTKEEMTVCEICGKEVRYPNNLRVNRKEVHLTCYWLKKFGAARAEVIAKQSGLRIDDPNYFHP